VNDDPRQLSCSSPDRDSRCPEFRFLWFSAVPQDILTWRRKRGEEGFCFMLSSLFFITPIHSISELLATPFNRLEIVIFLCPPPFFCLLSFLIIYPIQFALFSSLLCGSLRVTLHIPPFLHSFCSLFCDRFIAFSKACSPVREI